MSDYFEWWIGTLCTWPHREMSQLLFATQIQSNFRISRRQTIKSSITLVPTSTNDAPALYAETWTAHRARTRCWLMLALAGISC